MSECDFSTMEQGENVTFGYSGNWLRVFDSTKKNSNAAISEKIKREGKNKKTCSLEVYRQCSFNFKGWFCWPH